MTKHPATRLFVALPLLLVAAGWIALSTQRLTFTPESRVWVTGTSTVHDWTCEVGSFDGAVNLTADATTPDALTGVQVGVPVAALDCKNGTMDKKAIAALDAKAHPTIRFAFTGVRPAGTADGGLKLKVDGRLEIAGTSRNVTLDVVGSDEGDGAYRFAGTVPVRMSDYGIDAPTAMLGTLKTGDAVTVHFDVVAR